MSRTRDRAAKTDKAKIDKAERAHGSLLAEENPMDRRAYLRLGGWSIAATSAVILAMLANQSSLKIRRDEIAAADLALQARQVQMLSQQTSSDSKRLASAVDTLNSDRDRLYSRVSTLEQGLDSVTGSIGRQAAAQSLPVQPIAEAPPPAAPVASAPPADLPKISPATPLMASKSLMAPPEPTAGKLDAPPPAMVASAPPAEPAEKPVARSEFGIDLGIAPSVEGLRALWRQISTAHPALAALQPLIVIKEKPGTSGMQLRLVAGPLRDAGSAAQICAALPAGRLCEPAAYDGQKLATTTTADPAAPAPVAAAPAAVDRAMIAPSAVAPKPVVKRKPKPRPAANPAATQQQPAPPAARTSAMGQ